MVCLGSPPLLLVLVGAMTGLGTALLHLTPAPASSTSDKDCKNIKLVDESRRGAVREAVLAALCTRARPHVDLDPTAKTFAAFVLHRDAFSPDPVWHSGLAQDVLSDPYWVVNEVRRLKQTRYQWYTQGLPMWPLPHQAMPNATKGLRRLRALTKTTPTLDWPNYGIATPIYFASNAWRNQAWNAEEFFQEEEQNEKNKKKNKNKVKSTFQNVKEFHKLVKAVVEGVDGQRVESYSQWPFLKYSLMPMVMSMKGRNKGLCPDELYIYSRYTLCHPLEEAAHTCPQPAHHARVLLTLAGCPSTNVILGYSLEYNNNAV